MKKLGKGIIIVVILFAILGIYGCIQQIYEPEELTGPEKNTLWDAIKYQTGRGINYLDDKINFAIGLSDTEGNYLFCPTNGAFWEQLFLTSGPFVLLLAIWMIVFTFFFILIQNRSQNTQNAPGSLKERIPKIIFVVLLFILLFYIPIINRFLQIITLEVLGVNVIIRSLLVAAVIDFVPMMWPNYLKYKKRSKLYNEKLKEQTGREIARAMAKA